MIKNVIIMLAFVINYIFIVHTPTLIIIIVDTIIVVTIINICYNQDYKLLYVKFEIVLNNGLKTFFQCQKYILNYISYMTELAYPNAIFKRRFR